MNSTIGAMNKRGLTLEQQKKSECYSKEGKLSESGAILDLIINAETYVCLSLNSFE